jgi:PAS domain S-box-containing protein
MPRRVESHIGPESPGIQPASERPERLASLLTLSYEPMFAWQLDGPVEFWNAGAERLYGFAANEAVGRSSHTLLQTEFPVQFAELSSQLRNGHYWSGELRHICKDGHQVIVDSRMQLLGDGTVLEVNRDVTDQRRIEIALRESEQRLRWLASIVEFSDDAIVSKDLNSIITSWNKGAERIFGYTAEEVVGQPITVLIPSDRLNEEHLIIEQINRGEQVTQFETVRRRKDDSEFPVSLTVSPILGADGQIVGASKIIRDISERVRAQARLHDIQTELFRVSRVDTISHMASAIAHELNQPLSAISNYLKGAQRLLAGRTEDDLSVQNALAHAAEQALRAGQIVRRMRDFIGRGETGARIESLSQLVHEASELVVMGAKAVPGHVEA